MNDITELIQMLGITDTNITIDNSTKFHTKVKSNGNTINYWHFKLSYRLRCPNCRYSMNKNGFKNVKYKAPITILGSNILVIKKQKYICKQCNKTALAMLKDINKFDHIMNSVKVKAALNLRENVSIKHIAKDCDISSNTVMRQAEGLASYYKTSYRYLPKNIAFDDFKSGKMSPSGMSMALMNSDTHQLIDIIQSRTGKVLEDYFLRYSYLARLAVQTVTVDLYSPYRGIIERVFPKAIIIADRFHLVNQVYTALNKERIKVMKFYGNNTPEYRQLKRFYKLLFKKSADVNFTIYKPRRNFKNKYLTDSEIVERLLSLSPSLRDAYEFYQDIVHIVTITKSSNKLDSILKPTKYDKQYPNLPETMKKAKRTLGRYQQEIENSFKYNYSNGPLEGINNKIKVINRTAYGHHSFRNFRLRILISFSNTYFSKLYIQKATELAKNSVA